MPRPFIVEIYIEESAFGSVMRKLDNMEGVISINWDADRERGGKSKPNGEHPSAGKPRPQYEKSGREVLYEALYKSPLNSSGIKDAFIAAGRPAASMASVLHLAKKQGDVRHSPDGGYALTKNARDRMTKQRKRK
jgi:hypothetical protein